MPEISCERRGGEERPRTKERLGQKEKEATVEAARSNPTCSPGFRV